MVDLMFGVFGAAMFAEPAVADIEEVIGLIHGQKGVGCRVLGVGFANLIRRSKQRSLNPTPNPLHLFSGGAYPAFLSVAPALKFDDHCE